MKLLNLLTDKNQENVAISGGRSMVEMLGVLAIIGVLSVGGIVGYNTAMYKHRMNKTIQTFSTLLSNVIEVSNEKWDSDSISGRAAILAYDLLPEEMCPEDQRGVWGDVGNYCKLPLGNVAVQLYRYGKSSSFSGLFIIDFYEGNFFGSCVDFLSQGWQNMYPQEWLIGSSNIYVSGHILNEGDSTRRFWSAKQNVTLSDVQTACDVCKSTEYCRISMHMRGR